MLWGGMLWECIIVNWDVESKLKIGEMKANNI